MPPQTFGRQAFQDADALFLKNPENKGKYAANVVPTHLRTDKLFDLTDESAMNDLIKKFGFKDKQELYDNLYSKKNTTFNKFLAKQGYEGAKHGHEVVIFNPKNIRSVNAKFDPKKANSKNILAGTAWAGLLGGLSAKGEE